MAKLRVGIVGLGGIAQKAWLPVLSAASNWTLQGAFSPAKQKAQQVCEIYRIPYVSSIADLAAQCDAVFFHSATSSHYAVVSELLRAGVNVCVDKPLAENLADAERLVELAARQKCTLMVGFNRRFSPLYQQLKQKVIAGASLRMDKHRADSVGPHDVQFTLLDDYLHVVDTVLWLVGGEARLLNGTLQTNQQGQMLYAEHHFAKDHLYITTSMHRRAGSQREWIQVVTDGGLYDVTDMHHWREETGSGILHRPVPGGQSTLEQRGFVGCAHHFLESVANQTVPETSGEQALLAHRVIEKLWREAMSLSEGSNSVAYR